jgi:hypothetical protein
MNEYEYEYIYIYIFVSENRHKLKIWHSSITLQIHNKVIPRGEVLFEKLSVFWPVKEFPAFYQSQSITAFTRPHHLSLSLNWSAQSYVYFFKTHLNIILPRTPKSSKWSLSFAFPYKTFTHLSSLPPYRGADKSLARPTSISIVFFSPGKRW